MRHPGVNAYEDRRLEVTSQLPIDIEAQVRLFTAPSGFCPAAVGQGLRAHAVARTKNAAGPVGPGAQSASESRRNR
jgi:hypothetical protein